MSALIDMAGQRFGRWVVISRAPNRPSTCGAAFTYWNCVCDCGKPGTINSKSLRIGDSTSCGCATIERAATLNFKHGKTGTPEFTTWQGIKQRCYDPKAKSYPNYGGRHIKVCDRWRHSFENFVSDMGLRPSPRHMIERKNNGGNYEPLNCKWATRKEQNRNTRQNHFITIDGRTLCISEWAEVMGIQDYTISLRIKRGWPERAAVMKPNRSRLH